MQACGKAQRSIQFWFGLSPWNQVEHNCVRLDFSVTCCDNSRELYTKMTFASSQGSCPLGVPDVHGNQLQAEKKKEAGPPGVSLRQVSMQRLLRLRRELEAREVPVLGVTRPIRCGP